MIVAVASLWLVALGALVSPPAASAQQLLDHVVARVGNTAITQTDVDAAVALGFVEPQSGPEANRSAVQQLIERRLMLNEVARFPPSDPPAAAIDDLVATMKAHAGVRYDAVLKGTGLDEAHVRELARDTLRIRAYVDQRFGTSAQVSVQDARDYYETHPDEFRRDGVVPPFEQVESKAREIASAARRTATVARWVTDLRARGDVVETTPPR